MTLSPEPIEPELIDGAENSEPSARRGFVLVLAATAAVGVCGYIITWLVPRVIGVSPYAEFAIFWSFIFLVAAALSGVQQEMARASHPSAESSSGGARAHPRRFAAVFGVVVLAVLLATGPIWVALAFQVNGWALVVPVAFGGACYVLLATLTGLLYGRSDWNLIFVAIIVEGLGRLAMVGVTVALTHDVIALAWAVVIPFGLAFVTTASLYAWKRSIHAPLDVGYRTLSWNVARTVVAAAAMGVLVSGYPLVLGMTSSHVPHNILGAVILASTLTRAPLIVVGMALQSYLVVFFKSRSGALGRSIWALLAVVVILGILLTLLASLFGPPVFAFLFPDAPLLSGAFMAALVGSSILVGALCVTAPAVLAMSRHALFTAGWLTAAIATVFVLVLPLDFMAKTVASLIAGPLVGLAVHLVGIPLALRNRAGTAPQATKR
ncbi:lipopolysaccharide biosynthesis protein [Rathayibacter sp. KR2-224]|uniref:lipopolysaccharide biosynthesis protein n=1 Tax=Rathayibacter sp. KR2-224 TaxID=3400913 RepID=UPI003C077186